MAEKLDKRFAELPKVVQDAIRSADVEQHLRSLADTHKLHIDQWERLENEVMLTLMGFEKIEELQPNIEKQVGLPAELAKMIADDISRVVFEPIRQELERQLSHPEAKAATGNEIDEARKKILEVENAAAPKAPAPLAATPPAPPPTEKAVRAPLSETYIQNGTSADRKAVEGDPYREQVA